MEEIVVLDRRVRQLLINDKKDNPNKIINLIKSEMFYILKNYMEINIDDIDLDIGIDNDGKYLISMSCEASRIFTPNRIF